METKQTILKHFWIVNKAICFKNFVYDVTVLVYLQQKIWIVYSGNMSCLKLKSASFFPEDQHVNKKMCAPLINVYFNSF